MLPDIQIEDILKQVQKPGRYLGGEWNAVKKDPKRAKLKVVLAFPDLYEIGMSYLGQKILYFLLNQQPSILAERVFAPAADLERVLREKKMDLFSLENKIPLHQFDVLGFSLLYELNYSSVLTILDLGRIPIWARSREERHPLVIGGGPAVFNPEPVAEIFDLFLIGEGEEAVFEILDKLLFLKREGTARPSILKELAKIKGVYVPSLYTPFLPSGSSLLAVKPLQKASSKIKKRVVYPFSKAPFPEKIVVPNVGVIFDRVAVEVARGCPQNCRFCQAASIYFPSRVKDPSFVVNTLYKSLRSTGYENASLTSLSVSDYPYLDVVVKDLMKFLEMEKISLSLSSLRPKGLSESVADSIIQVRKTGLTIVPEAGTERLRRVINKKLTEEEIFKAAALAFSRGWKLLKLYFMVGLPTEREDDLHGIVRLVEEVLGLGKKTLGKSPQINLSISSFIPKPHTPFQWLGMADAQTLREKHAFVKSRLKRYRFLRFKNHPVNNSILEGIFSRGDRRLNSILIRAWENGARFDGWSDSFDFRLWEKAFEEEKLDYTIYLSELPTDAVLPWDHLDTGIKKEHLLQELDRALAEKASQNCLEKDCDECQGCIFWPLFEKEFVEKLSVTSTERHYLGKRVEGSIRYWTVYSKRHQARFLSHNDLSNIIQRGFRRAGVPVQYSEGFHPKMIVSYLPALPLGMEGEEEVMEFRSSYSFSETAFLSCINDYLPGGIQFIRLETVNSSRPSLNEEIQTFVYSLKIDSPQVAKLTKSLIDKESFIKNIIENAEGYRPGILEKVFFSEKEEKFRFHIRYDRHHPVRVQDLVEEIFHIKNSVFLMSREKVIFKNSKKRSV